MSRKLWEREARTGRKEEARGPYLSGLFIEAVDRGMMHLDRGTDIPRILKTDLWNEGADFQKNVLGHYAGGRFRLYGIDLAGDVVRAVKVPEIQRTQGELLHLPFRSGTFDMVLDISTIDHVPHASASKVLDGYGRILRDRGILVMVVDAWGFAWRAYYAYQKRVRGKEVGVFPGTDIPNQYIYRPVSMHELLKTSGFQVLEQYSIDWFGWSWNRVTIGFWRWMMKRYRSLIRMEYCALSRHMKPFAKQYVFIARKQQRP